MSGLHERGQLQLNDKVAVVSGGSSGNGLGAAKAFAAEGARVVITGRNQVALNKAVAEIGGDTIGIQSEQLSSPTSTVPMQRWRSGRIGLTCSC